jgi:hypothetical protein
VSRFLSLSGPIISSVVMLSVSSLIDTPIVIMLSVIVLCVSAHFKKSCWCDEEKFQPVADIWYCHSSIKIYWLAVFKKREKNENKNKTKNVLKNANIENGVNEHFYSNSERGGWALLLYLEEKSLNICRKNSRWQNLDRGQRDRQKNTIDCQRYWNREMDKGEK